MFCRQFRDINGENRLSAISGQLETKARIKGSQQRKPNQVTSAPGKGQTSLPGPSQNLSRLPGGRHPFLKEREKRVTKQDPGSPFLQERGQGVGLASSVNFTLGDRGYGGFFRVYPSSAIALVILKGWQAAQFPFVPLK